MDSKPKFPSGGSVSLPGRGECKFNFQRFWEFEWKKWVVTWGLPGLHVSSLATYTPATAFPVSPSPTSAEALPRIVTVRQQEPAPQSTLLEIRSRCSSLNRISASTDLFIRISSFDVHWSPLFFSTSKPAKEKLQSHPPPPPPPKKEKVHTIPTVPYPPSTALK